MKGIILILVILTVAYLAYGWVGVFWTMILTITPIAWLIFAIVFTGKNKIIELTAKYPKETKAFLKELEKKEDL